MWTNETIAWGDGRGKEEGPFRFFYVKDIIG